MEVLHRRCAGIDVSKKDAKVCVRIAGAGPRGGTEQKVRTWGATTNQILALREHLIHQQVSLVVMEATGDYWKPFYYLLEDAGFELQLANPRHVRNLPGRKTDVSDAAWLADLGAHGLTRGSLVPPPPIRVLRDLTRSRALLTRDRTREYQRLEKLLEDAGIKLTSVASDITGVSVRAMIEALIAGQRDPVALASLARTRLRAKIPDLTEALVGRFSEHHAFLARMHLDLIDQHTVMIDQLTERIEELIEPYRGFRDLICTIPGIDTVVAAVVIAETGADMTRFPSPQHLASWAGTAPGSHESAGRSKSTKTRKGDSYLKGALGIAVMAISRTNNTHLGAKYRRLAKRRGESKAIVALERTLLETIWNMATTGVLYQELGAEHYTNAYPERAKRQALNQLRKLGYTVTLQPAS